jgi:hypothetical protein
MRLDISASRAVEELQHDFSVHYPYLKLDFYKMRVVDPVIRVKEHLPDSALLKMAGLRQAGSIEVKDEMTVAELEQSFLDLFGLRVQVSRKSGNIWLETTMTDNWSLQKQNDYGREITTAPEKSSRFNPGSGNYHK